MQAVATIEVEERWLTHIAWAKWGLQERGIGNQPFSLYLCYDEGFASATDGQYSQSLHTSLAASQTARLEALEASSNVIISVFGSRSCKLVQWTTLST